MSGRVLAELLLTATLQFLPTAARAQNDDFGSGNDAGWTRYDPIAPFGYSTTYSFPRGGYRIAAPGTGDPAVGPGRAGSLREDRTYTQFQLSADITNWDTSHPQAIGLLARVTDPGLLTTDGYALTYSTVDRTLDLSRMDNEFLAALTRVPVATSAATSLRLLFVGVGSSLEGEVLDAANPAAPLASVRANDARYDHGFNGLFVLDSGDGTHGAAATFGRYVSPVLSGDANLDGAVDFTDLVTLARHYGSSGATWSTGDFDADGTIDFADLTALARNYGQRISFSTVAEAPSVAPLPEPAFIESLWLGLLLFCRRRSKQFRGGHLTLQRSLMRVVTSPKIWGDVADAVSDRAVLQAWSTGCAAASVSPLLLPLRQK